RRLIIFYGEYRGNPGPGGSSREYDVELGLLASLVRVCWMSSISYATSTTTNNYAENMGLLSGFRVYLKRQWSPLHIVGDHELITRQHVRRNAASGTSTDNILEMQTSDGNVDGAYMATPP
ncbi:hypothetical protein JG688_00012176, partial [Phytophthora aleatoria]